MSPSSSFPFDRSKAVTLLQFFFVCYRSSLFVKFFFVCYSSSLFVIVPLCLFVCSFICDTLAIVGNTLPLYNTVRYNAVLYITRFNDGSQKCIDYIFQYNLYIFVWI